MKRFAPIVSIVWILSFSFSVSGRNMKVINDFSNNAILSLCQDEDGILWVGTCDGLNIYNGLSASLYTTSDGKELSGNLIEEIIETDKNIFWVNAHYGLNKIDKTHDTIEYFNQFQGNYKMRSNALRDIFILDENYHLYYNYRGKSNSFHRLQIPFIEKNSILDYLIDSNNKIWIFTKNNQHISFQLTEDEDNRYTIAFAEPFSHDFPLLYCFNEENIVFLLIIIMIFMSTIPFQVKNYTL